MTAPQELFALADRLDEASRSPDLEAASPALERLDECAAAVGRAFSGSWLGYHARVYYAGLQAPPPGAHFSQEWGLMDMSLTSMGSVGDWREFQSEAILDHIRTQADNPDLATVAGASEHAGELFQECTSEIRSILLTEIPVATTRTCPSYSPTLRPCNCLPQWKFWTVGPRRARK